jgi:hypothetical protein
MTKSIEDLHLEIVGDLQKCFLAYLQKLAPTADFSHEPPGWVVSVLLPLRVSLRRSPGNKLILTVEKRQILYLSSQQAQVIKTYTKDNRLTKATAIVKILKLSLLTHKNLRTITALEQAEYGKNVTAFLDIKLLGKIKWDEKHADNTAA